MTTNTERLGVFPPGEFIKDEMEERGWSQSDLADILGRSSKLVSEILSGKRGITPETAKGLGDAFGTGAQVWLNLESAYRLSLVDDSADNAVSRKARLYEKAPVKEMIRRGWIEDSKSIGRLEGRVMEFFQIQSINEEPSLLAAARAKDSEARAWTPSQLAWMFRALQLGSMVSASAYSKSKLRSAISKLRHLLADAENVRLVPPVLADAGVRFVIVEHTKGSRIDGATLWLDRKSPVVAMSLRFDRVDYFWHTLLHELAHVLEGTHEVGLDVGIAGPDATREDWSESEHQADGFAVEKLVPQEELAGFIRRVGPLYSEKRIVAFAALHKIHPALVLGQLKHRGEVPWKNLARIHTKIRETVTDAALCDGWGHVPPRG